MSWTDLEAMTDKILLEGNPRLRTTLRELLNRGVSPVTIRQRWGLNGKRTNLTACTVDAIVAEWEREVDAIADELRTRKGGTS